MTDTTISIFEKLSTEVVHIILDNLDTSEIFYSLYNVCRRLNGILFSYNHYKLDFSSMSRSKFNFFINIIETKNIISLSLSDDDRTPGQIGLFLSLINIKELRRLRSLILLQVEERHLLIFLENVFLDNLCSLTIKWRRGARYRDNGIQILTRLSSIISQPNLRYLDLNLWIYEIKNLSWPTDSTLRYVRIDECSFSEYCLILRHSPYLKTFVINNSSMYDVDYIFSSPSFVRPSYDQLFSLSLENIRNIRMITLTSFLSVTPSLVHLKLIGSGSLTDNAFDGSQWETFLEQDLYFLEKFQFFFLSQRNTQQYFVEDFPLIIPFSKSFWTKKKCWFVTCDFIKSTLQVRLYSLPICQPCLEYIPQSNLFSHSTLITKNDDAERINDIRMINVNLSSEVHKQFSDFMFSHPIKNPVFDQVIELKLELDRQWPLHSLEFLSMTFDLSRLVKISLSISFDKKFAQSTINGLNTLFKQTPNVHTFQNDNYTANAEIICSIVPHHVKYLQTKMTRINDMKIVLERLEHLSSVTFHFPIHSSTYPTKIIKWLKLKKTSFTFWCTSDCIHI